MIGVFGRLKLPHQRSHGGTVVIWQVNNMKFNKFKK